MDYFRDVCDKTTKTKSKSKHHKSLTHNEIENCTRTKNTIENPNFFHKDEIFTNYITNHIKKFNLYLVEYDFSLVFERKFNLVIKSALQ